MNRLGAIDSKLSLDVGSRTRESVNMIAQPYRLYIERKDAAKNMARFYAMSIEPTLFGDVCLVRRWGRIGARGQRMEHSFTREEEAVALFLSLLRQKRRRGYRPRGK
jgi:predicted DNA-binding WGR domain protein